MYDREYSYAICIPQKNSVPSLEVAWYTPTADNFIIPTGSKFAVGTLRETKVKAFETSLQILQNHCHHISKQISSKDILCLWVCCAQHDITHLHHHPLIFRDLVVFVAQLQRTLLDIHAVLNYVEILHPLLVSPPSKPVCTNPTWMGCFTNSTSLCEELYLAGIPVWRFHREPYISLTMNIVNPV